MPRNRARLIALAGAAVPALLLAPAGLPAQAARAAGSWLAIRYGGASFVVPSSWPVYDLARQPSTCVRFDHHAVYEGAASPDGRCPARAIGVSEAVQVQPIGDIATAAGSARLRSVTINGDQALVATNDQVTHRVVAAFPQAGVVVTISYRDDRALAEKILASFTALPTGATGSTRAGPGATSNSSAAMRSQDSTVRAAPRLTASTVAPVLFTGKGFDTCQAPSEPQMAAWKSASPYRAVGVYIGGANAACTNITATWVRDEANAGWYLFPIYVGLQAPCVWQPGLATIDPSKAASEGTQAADNAVSQAASFAMGAGTTVYYDMEAWDTNGCGQLTAKAANAAVATFTAAWTDELHAKGYVSGFYGSADSGISQVIVPMYGHTGAPDDLYFGQWDSIATTKSPYIPAGDWANHQRIKQYDGDVTETWGSVTIQIDHDYLDAPTLGDPRPVVTGVSPASAIPGSTVTVTGSGFVPGATTVDFGSVQGTKVSVTAANRLTATVPSQVPATVDVTVTTVGGTSASTAGDKFSYVPFVSMDVDPSTGGYWVATSRGNVYRFHAPFYGSTARQRLPAPVVGIAATATGYLLVTAQGNVFDFNTAFDGSTARRSLPAPVVGIAAVPGGGYDLVTAKGNVYNFGAPFHGSMANKPLPAPVVGIAATASGYLLVTARGNVFNFNTTFDGSTARRSLPAPVVGIAAVPGGGYDLVTAKGNVYNFGAPFHGSMANKPLPAPVVTMAVTGTGYLLGTSVGTLYNFNTASYGSPASPG